MLEELERELGAGSSGFSDSELENLPDTWKLHTPTLDLIPAHDEPDNECTEQLHEFDAQPSQSAVEANSKGLTYKLD